MISYQPYARSLADALAHCAVEDAAKAKAAGDNVGKVMANIVTTDKLGEKDIKFIKHIIRSRSNQVQPNTTIYNDLRTRRILRNLP
jgi:hypothetical protein